MVTIQITDEMRRQAGEYNRLAVEDRESRGRMNHTTRADASEFGFLAEAAFAAYTGWEWTGFIPGQSHHGEYPPDVGPCEVRATRTSPPVLYFKDFDNDDRPFVLVTIEDNIATFRGWMYGFYCRRREWYTLPRSEKNIRPGQKGWWQVPVSELWPMELLWRFEAEVGHPCPRLDVEPVRSDPT